MRTIWKITVSPTVLNAWHEFVLPHGAKFLAAMAQGDGNCLWFEVDTSPDNPRVSHRGYVCGTGHALPGGFLRYLGTIVREALVYHFYELA